MSSNSTNSIDTDSSSDSSSDSSTDSSTDSSSDSSVMSNSSRSSRTRSGSMAGNVSDSSDSDSSITAISRRGSRRMGHHSLVVNARSSRGTARQTARRGRTVRGPPVPNTSVLEDSSPTLTSNTRNATQPPATTTSQHNHPSDQNIGALDFSVHTVNFECIVCLENLDSPATIVQSNDEVADQQDLMVVDLMDAAPIMRVGSGPSARGRGGRVGGTTGRVARNRALSIMDPREIVSTPCGHMYHRYCIEKWFMEQGKKTCPSCRKNVTNKVIRLYPNIGQENNGNRYNGGGATTSNWTVGSLPNLAATTTTATTVGQSANSHFTQNRQVPFNNCINPSCADLKMIHETLVSDFNELRDRFVARQDDLDLRTAEMASLQESHDRLNEELAELRAAGNKRRRCNR